MASIGTVAAVVGIAGTVASVAGTVIQARAQRQAGIQEQAAANYEARQLDSAAAEEVAAGQREALETQRQGALLNSRGRAVAAASGAGATDASVLDALADVQRETDYRSGISMYGGVQRARGLRAQATARRMAGRAALTGSRLAAAGTIIGGLGSAAMNAYSWFATYGQGRPSSTPATGGNYY